MQARLKERLRELSQHPLIGEWIEHKIQPGRDWRQAIISHLNTAHIILLLISADFLASDFCYSIEMQQALQRHKAGEAYVIPIILRPIDIEKSPFGRLNALPKNHIPVIEWSNHDKAFLDIVGDVKEAIEEFFQRSPISVPIQLQGLSSVEKKQAGPGELKNE